MFHEDLFLFPFWGDGRAILRINAYYAANLNECLVVSFFDRMTVVPSHVHEQSHIFYKDFLIHILLGLIHK